MFKNCFKSKVSSPLKHVLRTRSDDSWPLIEFAPCEKHKYQVTFVTKNKNISLHLHTTSSRTVSNLKAHLELHLTKILSRTHRKCQSKPIYEYFLLFYRRINMAVLNSIGIKTSHAHTIYLYNKKFDWLFIVDPIWLVWHTYISHSLTHSSIDPSITYPMCRLRSFLQKKTQKWQQEDLLDLITVFLKFNCFVNTTATTQCTFQSSPWWFIDYCKHITWSTQTVITYCTIAVSLCEIYDDAMVLIWKFARDMPMNDTKGNKCHAINKQLCSWKVKI